MDVYITKENIFTIANITESKEIPQLSKNAESYLNDVFNKSNIEFDLFYFKVIFSELVLNAVFHGGGCDKVSIKINKSDKIVMFVENKNRSIEKKACHNNKNNNIMNRQSGRGIMLVEGLCKSFKICRKGRSVKVIIKNNR